jgi:hypothetical protein
VYRIPTLSSPGDACKFEHPAQDDTNTTTTTATTATTEVERRRQAWVAAHRGDKGQQGCEDGSSEIRTAAQQRAEAWRAAGLNKIKHQPQATEKEGGEDDAGGCAFDMFDADSLQVAMSTASTSTTSEAMELPEVRLCVCVILCWFALLS